MTRRRQECTVITRTETLLAGKERDEISREDREWLSHHLSACPICYERALTLDPLVSFSSLSAFRDPEAEAFGFEPAVEEQRQMAHATSRAMHIEILKRRLAPAVSPVLLRAASLFLVAGGLVAFISFGQKFLGGSPERTPLLKTLPVSNVPAGTMEARLPWIEGVKNPEAKVYQFTPSSQKEPMVVFVVDQNVEF